LVVVHMVVVALTVVHMVVRAIAVAYVSSAQDHPDMAQVCCLRTPLYRQLSQL
jgi:hypothetical protein